MPSHNMSGFVRQHAGNFVFVVGFHQGSGMDEHVVAVADKSVQAVVINDVNVIAVERNVRRFENRSELPGQKLFGFFVRNQAD